MSIPQDTVHLLEPNSCFGLHLVASFLALLALRLSSSRSQLRALRMALARLLGSALVRMAAEEGLFQECRVWGGVISGWLLGGGRGLNGSWRGDCSLCQEADFCENTTQQRKPRAMTVRKATIGNWQPGAALKQTVHSRAQHSRAQHSTAQQGTAQHSTAQPQQGTAQRSRAEHSHSHMQARDKMSNSTNLYKVGTSSTLGWL